MDLWISLLKFLTHFQDPPELRFIMWYFMSLIVTCLASDPSSLFVSCFSVVFSLVSVLCKWHYIAFHSLGLKVPWVLSDWIALILLYEYPYCSSNNWSSCVLWISARALLVVDLSVIHYYWIYFFLINAYIYC